MIMPAKDPGILNTMITWAAKPWKKTSPGKVRTEARDGEKPTQGWGSPGAHVGAEQSLWRQMPGSLPKHPSKGSIWKLGPQMRRCIQSRMWAWPGSEFEHNSDSWFFMTPDSFKQQGVKVSSSIIFLLALMDRCLQCVGCYYPLQPPVVSGQSPKAGACGWLFQGETGGGSILGNREK